MLEVNIAHRIAIVTLSRPPVNAINDDWVRLFSNGLDDLAARPGWSRMYAVRAAIALRVHDCDRAFEAFLELLEFGVDRPDWPAMVQKCREERG